MSDGIKRFPPEFDSTKKYPRQYDLEQIDVYVEASPGEYFNINGLPENIGFGKHAFTIFVTEPDGMAPLRNFSNVLFEAKDSAGTLIFSGTTNQKDLSGASVCFIWVKEDPITTKKNIQEGIGSLTIVGQLQDVPTQYQNVYNVRTTFPLNIRTEFLNTSPILFQSSSKIASNVSITETLEADIDNPNFNKSYANITLKNLETFGGEVETIQISYLESGSLSVLEDEEFTFLTQQKINKVSGSFEDDIDFRISRGLNPISQSLRAVMPSMANQSGSNFNLNANKFKFKFEFLNKNNEKAKDFHSGEDLNITSSFINFVGPANVIGGEGNLIDGQLFLGNAVNQGMEFSAENSAFIRSIGYLGFTSASAGSGSGFMLYSGSVLSANTDDYALGGVGFEFVSSSDAFMRFNTNPGLFDVRAKSFFVGSNTTQFISGSGENIEISSSKFHLKADGSLTMSGKLAVEAGGTIGGFTISDTALSTDAFILSSSQNENDPGSFISSSNFKVSAGGVITASSAFIENAIITGSTEIDVGNDIKVKGIKVAALNINNNIVLGDENAIITASAGVIDTLTYSTISGSVISASGIRVEGDMVLDGSVTANTFVTNVIEENFSTGNTIFGNSNDDIHSFTGSLNIRHTGSNNIGLLLSGSDMRVLGDISASRNIVIGQTGSFGMIHQKDNQKIVLGTGRDFQIYHSGANSFIQDQGTGNLKILASNLDIQDKDGADYIKAVDNSGVTIYYNDVEKFQTQAGGVNVTGHISASGDISSSGNVSGDRIFVGDGTEGAPAIAFNLPGQEDVGFYRRANNTIGITAGGDGQVVIGPTGVTIGDGYVGNNNSAPEDGLIVQGKVGIGTTSPSHSLDVNGTGRFDVINYASNQNGGISLVAGNQPGSDRWEHKLGLKSNSGGSPRATIEFIKRDASGNVENSATSESISFNSAGDITITTGSLRIGTSTSTGNFILVEGRDDENTYDGLEIKRKYPRIKFTDTVGTDDSMYIWHLGNEFRFGSDAGSSTNAAFVIQKGTSADAYFNGNLGIGTGPSPSEKLDVRGNIKTDGNISSPSFESGFAGSGFRITSGSNGKQSFTIDDLTVRGQMSVFEMLIHQVRATNGSLFVSNTGRIVSSSLIDADDKSYRLYFDTGSGYGHSFRPGDVIRAQRFTPDTNGSGSTDGPASYKSDLTIESVTGISESIARLTGSVASTDAPTAGYEYVRIGSISDTDRQGAIYLTADDENAPFIDVADGVTSHAGFNTTGTVKTRMGKLSGITSEKFGTLTGYGFYASGSAFLEGSINADKGSVGGWSLSNSIISSSNITLDSGNEKITIENTTFGASGVQLENDGGGKFYAGDGSNKFLQFDGTNALIKSPSFELDSSGNITASNALLSGKLTSTEGEIGGFTINEKSLTSNNFTLSASSATNELFISHSSFKVRNSGQVTASALILTGSENTNFLQFANGILTVRGDVAASTLSTTNFNVNSAGQITASAGTIGGFTISSTSLTSGSKIVLDASQSLFSINDRTFGNDGIQLDFNEGTPRAFVGKKQGEHFKFDGTNVNISSSNFYIGSGEQFISGSGGKLQIRAQDAVLSGSSVRIQTDDFFLGAQDTFVSGANNQIEISSSQFHLDRDGNASFGGDIQVGSQATQTDLNEGLIVHYNFDQFGLRTRPGTRFPLLNNVEHLSRLSASFTSTVDGFQIGSGSNAIANSSLFFSGSDRTGILRMTESETIISTEDKYSVSFFIKPLNVERKGGPQMIYNWGGSSNGLTAIITSSKVITNFYENNKGSVTSASIANDTMYHVVTTYNGGEAKIYLDSQLIQTSTTGNVGSINGFSGDFDIGGDAKDGEFYLSSGSTPVAFNDSFNLGICAYEGFLDELRVYQNKVLSQNEVTALFLNPQANTSNVVYGGQITAGIIKSLNSGDGTGTILNLQQGELHVGGSGSNARFLFDNNQLRVSASNFFVGSESFISGSGDKIEISSSGFHLKPEGDAIFSGSITAGAGKIANWDINAGNLSAVDSDGGISIDAGNKIITTRTGSASNTVNILIGEISTNTFGIRGKDTSGNTLFDLGEQGNTIGGFTITNQELSIDNIKLSSLQKGLVISSSNGTGRVLIASGSLSSTIGSTINYFVTPSFEGLTADTLITGSHGGTLVGGWHIENDTATGSRNEELWNSGSVSMSLADSSAGDGSIHLRINVKRELGPPGSGLADSGDSPL